MLLTSIVLFAKKPKWFECIGPVAAPFPAHVPLRMFDKLSLSPIGAGGGTTKHSAQMMKSKVGRSRRRAGPLTLERADPSVLRTTRSTFHWLRFRRRNCVRFLGNSNVVA